jgi:hypothetical protein
MQDRMGVLRDKLQSEIYAIGIRSPEGGRSILETQILKIDIKLLGHEFSWSIATHVTANLLSPPEKESNG